MFLSKLQVFNFKNYESAALVLHPHINCFVGLNGSGKTNLLDAIHYLALTKSAFNTTDLQNIHYEMPFFMVEGKIENYQEGETQQLMCVVKQGERKVFKVNQQPYDKMAEHIGKYPCVLIAPSDTDLIKDGSEERRKFFDGLIAQLNPVYLANLMQYNQLLKRRNALLKQFSEKKFYDETLLQTYSEPLIALGIELFKERQKVSEEFIPIFQKNYQNFTKVQEYVSLAYHTQWETPESYRELFAEAKYKDKLTQRTNVGIHKDDYVFEIDQRPLKKFASQGQQKSFVIALKLAKFEILLQSKKVVPILLLDDIFDKLDQSRITQLLRLVTAQKYGQLFITDANAERTKQVLESLSLKAKVFQIQKGEVQNTYDI